MYDILVSVEWKISPLDILETERRYPGVMGSLATESWITRLIREQLEGSGKPKEAEIDGD